MSTDSFLVGLQHENDLLHALLICGTTTVDGSGPGKIFLTIDLFFNSNDHFIPIETDDFDGFDYWSSCAVLIKSIEFDVDENNDIIGGTATLTALACTLNPDLFTPGKVYSFSIQLRVRNETLETNITATQLQFPESQWLCCSLASDPFSDTFKQFALLVSKDPGGVWYIDDKGQQTLLDPPGPSSWRFAQLFVNYYNHTLSAFIGDDKFLQLIGTIENFLPPCFLCTTQILIEDGTYKLVKDLTTNDKVISPFTNVPQKVKKILKRAVYTNHTPSTNMPLIIKKNSISENMPLHDVFLSGHHRVFIETENNPEFKKVMGVQAFKLFGKENFLTREEALQITKEDELIYYNIELEDPTQALIASGLGVESFQKD